MSRKAQAGKPGYSQSLYNLKDAAKMLNFLQTNNIMDMTGLDGKFKTMIGEKEAADRSRANLAYGGEKLS